ncbi:hypothetical protein QAD02_012660 [Eretmocerus hayati]|uniref:Uncharacterized protein n=1 Tax=Eretmocerus hayati TaxID=131215 RepID=A0ACC2P179_9HYME|nr:hypothetical protein QAD02_012660 [Eretmocerus hayati]
MMRVSVTTENFEYCIQPRGWTRRKLIFEAPSTRAAFGTPTTNLQGGSRRGCSEPDPSIETLSPSAVLIRNCESIPFLSWDLGYRQIVHSEPLNDIRKPGIPLDYGNRREAGSPSRLSCVESLIVT